MALLQANDDAVQPSFGPEDSDAWLSVDAQDLDGVLEKRLGLNNDGRPINSDAMDVDEPNGTQSAEDRLAKEQASKLQEMAKKVENFLEGEGDLEGAKFEEYVFYSQRVQRLPDDTSPVN